jgi:diguanylate cyclase (GGDEF)-like protein/hemerythrin-like metal-binding protein/PAS domain S-box-containing protein
MDYSLIKGFFSHSPAGFAVMEVIGDSHAQPIDYRFYFVNANFAALIGWPEQRLVGATLFELFSDEPEMTLLCRDVFQSTVETGEHHNLNLYMTQLRQRMFLRVFRINKNHLGVILRDTTKEQIANQEVDAFLQINVEMFCICDIEGTIRKANRHFESVLGYSPNELKGRNVLDLVVPDDMNRTKEAIQTLHIQGTISEFINRYYRKNGDIVYLEWRGEMIDGLIYASARDITERSKAAEELQQIALTDALTGLYNRHYFYQSMDEAMHQADLHDRKLTLIIYDLDWFKNVNDKFGHPVGDEVLRHVSAVTRQHIRSSDIVFRMGGEEFAIFLPDADMAIGTSVAKRINQYLNNYPIPAVGYVTASFGVATRFPGESLTKWYTRADDVMYRIKRSGRNAVGSADDEVRINRVNVSIDWNPKWSCGHAEIDKQHMELLSIGNTLIELAYQEDSHDVVERQIDKLLEHVADHFQFEESVLHKVKYPHFLEHQKHHRKLIEKAMALKNRYLKGTLTGSVFFSFVLDDLIIGHLVEEDAKFFDIVTKPKTKIQEENHGS